METLVRILQVYNIHLHNKCVYILYYKNIV